jgi:Fe-Mn family superoxide dismutase
VEHSLPELPCAQDALAPHLSLETMHCHHGKRHQAHVDKFHALFLAHAVSNFA